MTALGGAGIPLPARLDAAAWEWPMVGRASELALLGEELRRAGGERRLALVGGEPGIGKTRLVSELATAAHADGAVVLFGRAVEGLAIPYLPFAEALGHLLEHAPPHLAGGLDSELAEIARIVPAAGPATRPGPTDPGGGSAQLRLFAAAAALLGRVSARAPLVLVIDDLHWADEGTLSLLRQLVTGRAELRALVVATYRTTEHEPDAPFADALARLGRERIATRIELSGLDDGETLSLVTDLVGHGLHGPEAELASLLRRETGGNPLFVAELVRSLIGAGTLEQDEGRWRLRDELDAIRLPASLTDVVAERLGALDADARDALAAAALIGPEFDPDVVDRALAREGADLAAAWDAAERAALIAPVGGGGTLAFSHPLVAHAIRDGLGARARGTLHGRIAAAIEASQPDPDTVQLARHWSLATPADPARALTWALRAGRQALDRFDGDGAADWYGRARELLGPAGALDGPAHCECLAGLGEAQRLGGDPAFRETLLEAARLAQRCGEHELQVQAALANSRGFVSSSGRVDDERVAVLESALRAVGDHDSAERAMLLARLAVELTFSGDWERRRALSDEAVAIARRLDAPAPLTQVLTERFVTTWVPATLGDRLVESEEAVALADEIGDPWLQFHAVHWRSVGLLQAGDMDAAAAAARRQDELAERIGDPTMRWVSTYDRANFAILAGRLDTAEGIAQDAARIAVESGQPDAVPFLTSQLTNIRFEQGRLPELQSEIARVVAANPGIPAFRAVLALAYSEGDLREEARRQLAVDRADGFASLPADVTWLASHAIYAHVAADVGDERAADLLYERLRPWAGQVVYTGISVWGDVDHALGRLATVLGRHATAAEHLAASAERYRRLGAAACLARCQLDSARLLVARGGPGDRDEAIAVLEETIAAARRLGAVTVERRALSLREHARSLDVAPGVAAGPLPPPGAAADANGGGAARGAERGRFVRQGDGWTLEQRGEQVRLRNSKGVRYLAELLRHPGVEITAVELQLGPGAPRAAAGVADPELGVRAAGSEDAGAVLDPAAKRAYRERIEELAAEIDEAERFNDPERGARARAEREAVVRELNAAVGLGGRDRRAASQAERARVNVTRAIRGTIAKVVEQDPRIGGHLRASVSTGGLCGYAPPPGQEIEWEVEGVDG